MSNYRIDKRYPVYPGGGCIPYTGYFVQVFVPGLFKGKWVDVKGFAESDLMVAIIIAAFTNFAGCYAGMYVFEKFKKQ